MRSLLNYREAALAPVMDEFNRLFDKMFSSDSFHSVRSKSHSGYPKLDVIETENDYLVEASVPGIKPEDLTVEVVPLEGLPNERAGPGRRLLRLSGRMNSDYQYSDKTIFHLRELRRSHFVRELLLPEYIDVDPVATYEAGILKLAWTKPEIVLKMETKRIPIQVISKSN